MTLLVIILLSRGRGKRYKQTNETQTFSPSAGVRHAIATKLGMPIEQIPGTDDSVQEICSIFSVPNHFEIRSTLYTYGTLKM